MTSPPCPWLTCLGYNSIIQSVTLRQPNNCPKLRYTGGTRATSPDCNPSSDPKSKPHWEYSLPRWAEILCLPYRKCTRKHKTSRIQNEINMGTLPAGRCMPFWRWWSVNRKMKVAGHCSMRMPSLRRKAMGMRRHRIRRRGEEGEGWDPRRSVRRDVSYQARARASAHHPRTRLLLRSFQSVIDQVQPMGLRAMLSLPTVLLTPNCKTMSTACRLFRQPRTKLNYPSLERLLGYGWNLASRTIPTDGGLLVSVCMVRRAMCWCMMMIIIRSGIN